MPALLFKIVVQRGIISKSLQG